MENHMEDLVIEASKYTPEIRFDCTNNILEIKGESYPENITDFYTPVFAWLEQFIDGLRDQGVTVNLELVYFNSSSSKVLMDFFDMLETAARQGKSITINWYYDEGDEDLLEFGEDFKYDLKSVQFNLLQKEHSSGETNAV